MSSFTLHYSEDLVRQAARSLVEIYRAHSSRGARPARRLHGLQDFHRRTLLVHRRSRSNRPAGNHRRHRLLRVHFARLGDPISSNGSPASHSELSDDRFRITSDLVSSEIRWPVIKKVWRDETFWLVFFTRTQSMILPLVDLPQESQDFIIQKVRDNGGTVK